MDKKAWIREARKTLKDLLEYIAECKELDQIKPLQAQAITEIVQELLEKENI